MRSYAISIQTAIVSKKLRSLNTEDFLVKQCFVIEAGGVGETYMNKSTSFLQKMNVHIFLGC